MNNGEAIDHHEVVIVGAGITGLATAVALHRKGIKSKVLERWEGLAAGGAAIGIWANGWRALDQLGVADTLRKTALVLSREREVWMDRKKEQFNPIYGECRCLLRAKLIKTLFDALPPGTVDFGREFVSLASDSQTMYPVLQLGDGTCITTKVLIGCDGGKTAFEDFLELKPAKILHTSAVRGLTNFPNGHPFPHESVRINKGKTQLGRKPMNDNLVYWYVCMPTPAEAKILRDPESIRQFTLDSLVGFPQDVIEMVKNSKEESLSIRSMRYRSPSEMLLAKFCKGTVTVAGDAMHLMPPFLAQGGSAGLEDAVVLARCLGRKLSYFNSVECGKKVAIREIGNALDDYVKERRMRLMRLCTQSYIIGLIISTPSLLMKFVYIFSLVILFRDNLGHVHYDCGNL